MFRRAGVAALFLACCIGAAINFPLLALADRAMVIPGQFVIEKKVGAISSSSTVSLPAPNRRPTRFYRRDNRCRDLASKDKTIASCAPNFTVQASDTDPYSFTCSQPNKCSWSADNVLDTDIDLPAARLLSEGDPGVVIAVLDTGIDLTHPDLQDNLWINPGEVAGNSLDDDGNGYVDDIHGVNVQTGGEPLDDNGHGTHVAGIIAALRNNSIGISGIAPKVKILAVKILDQRGSGTLARSIKGIDYIVDLVENRGIPVIVFNNSWGGSIPEFATLQSAFERANAVGILATAAAGNDGENIDSIPYYPARFSSLPNVITVAATTFSGRLADFSNFGPQSVTIAAPGDKIRSCFAVGTDFGEELEGGTVLASGTSMATPVVSAVVALIRSKFPALSYVEVKNRLLARSYELPSEDSQKIKTGLRVNAFYALSDDSIPLPTPLPTSIFTSTPTRTATPTSTVLLPVASPTVTPTASPESVITPSVISTVQAALKVNLRAAPISKFSKKEPQTYVSTQELNLIEISSNDNRPIKVSLNSGTCRLATVDIASGFSLLSLKLAGRAKEIRQLTFEIKELETVLADGVITVKGVKKVNRKAPKNSCAELSRKITFIKRS